MSALPDGHIESLLRVAQRVSLIGDNMVLLPHEGVAIFEELVALRKQANLDRQSREASQAEFARLYRELNEARQQIERYREMVGLYDRATTVKGVGR